MQQRKVNGFPATDIEDYGSGLIGYRGEFLEAAELATCAFKQLAKHFKAEETIYPFLLSTKNLVKHNYFRNFPHLIWFASSPSRETNALKHVSQYGEEGISINKDLNEPEWVLRPAMCFHVYEQFKDVKLPLGERLSISTQGSCFRHESESELVLPVRSRVFTMREIVFLGDDSSILEVRQNAIDLVSSIADIMGLNSTLEVASDPFFTNQKTLAFLQKSSQAKFEMILPTERGNIAAASFNYHHDHFSSAFNLRAQDESLLSTACIAFGIERWAYAYISEHSADKANWPIKNIQDCTNAINDIFA